MLIIHSSVEGSVRAAWVQIRVGKLTIITERDIISLFYSDNKGNQLHVER